MNKKTTSAPLSLNAKEMLNWNAFGLLVWLALAFGCALVTDWALEKTSLYDGLYGDPAYVIMHTGEEDSDYRDEWTSEWDDEKHEAYHQHANQKLYGPHFAGVEFSDGHALAHKGERYDDPVVYPAAEWRLVKLYALAYGALLVLTPLGPQRWLPRRKRYLAANQVDFERATRLRTWLETQQDPFASSWGVEGETMSFRPVRISFEPGADIVFFRDEHGEHAARAVADPLRAGFTLWAVDEQGKVWRLSGASTEVIRRFVTTTVREWLGVVSPRTHVGALLESYSWGKYRPRALEVVNQVVGDIADRKLGDRQPIRVQGVVVEPGLMLLTSIARADAREVLLPTAFMGALTGEVRQMTGRELPPANPRALAA